MVFSGIMLSTQYSMQQSRAYSREGSTSDVSIHLHHIILPVGSFGFIGYVRFHTRE